jgi:hypothetical protein
MAGGKKPAPLYLPPAWIVKSTTPANIVLPIRE